MSSIVPPTEESIPVSWEGQASATEVDVPSIHSSEAMIPHPSTDNSVPLSSSSAEVLEAPLTPEVYASGALPPGTKLGHFVIKSFIGGGGMGRVYLATDSALDRKVALKVLPRQRANDQGTVARFINEAKSAARLNHEHIAQVYFTGEEANIPFIVFEYVEGTNIRTLVEENGLFSVPQAITYLIQIAHALAHAAEHGVVHRDVKPSNVLITAAGRAKLIDMGLARLLDPSESKDDLTASGVTLGTFDYISPEQARDPRAADIRSDIYSLGCTFFFMLTGQPPFPEGTVLQKLLQHQGDAPPDVRTFQPNIPPEVALLIQKMMAKDPRQRFQKPRHLVESLIQVAEMLGLRPTEPGKLDWAMGVPGRKTVFEKHVPWFASVAALFVLFVLLHFFWNQSALDIPTAESGPFPDKPVTERAQPVSPTAAPVDKQQVSTSLLPTQRFVLNVPEQFDASIQRFLPHPDLDAVDIRWSEGERIGIGFAGVAISARESGAELSAALPFSKIQELNASTTGLGEAVIPRWTIDPSGKTPGAFLSLGAALAEAGRQATFELKWNGPLGVDPIFFVGRDLKVTAAPDCTPLLSFRPTLFLQNSRSMFSLNGSSLKFEGVAIEMSIDRNVHASRWTLFELFGSNKLEFTRCCLTIRNTAADFSAYHQEAAFFRTSPQQTGFEGLAIDDSPPLSETEASVDPTAAEIQIRFSESLLRGEANALLCATPQTIDFRLAHSFVALAKTFVRTEDAKRTGKQENLVRVLLARSFVYSRNSLVEQNRTSTASDQFRLEFDVESSIIRLNQTPLFESQGTTLPAKGAAPFRWTGHDNYFQNVSLGWRSRPIDPLSESETVDKMTLTEWKDRMGVSPTIDSLSLPEIRKPTHRLLPTEMLPESLADSLNIGPDRHRTIRLPSEWNAVE